MTDRDDTPDPIANFPDKRHPGKSPFITALAKAQSEMKNAVYNKVNPHFKSSYADLSSVREATIKALTSNGFTIIQTTELRDGVWMLKSELAHDSGLSRFSYWPLKMGTDQQQGSSLTFGRRYHWSGFCAIASEDDDDANEASKPPPESKEMVRQKSNYGALLSVLIETGTRAELKAFITEYQGEIDKLPQELKDTLGDAARRHREGLPE